MQSFPQFEYKRPDLSDLKKRFETTLNQLQSQIDVESILKSLKDIEALRSEWDTMNNLSYIRHTIDTSDEFYDAEKEYFSNHHPEFQELETNYFRILPTLPEQEALRASFGEQLFIIAELMQKTFDTAIISNLKEENNLSDQFIKIVSQAKIPFRGETYNISGIGPFEKSEDRETRKEAALAKWGFYESKVDEIEGIYDKMVHLRADMATELGYRNFITMGYNRMLRSDYDDAAVKRFRDKVHECIVPIVQKLLQRQANRIGIDKMRFFDEPILFKSGNPKPIGTTDEVVAKARKMYDELSPETGAFFRFMEERELLDLNTKENKAPMGYCTYISQYKAPFIFSNFNGTSDDIDVLTHEAGHAFQVFMSRHLEQIDYKWPTADAAEIHSMSMEFFTWPWMDSFFGEDSDKYKFGHLSRSLSFLPYGVLVDEFQHGVYENPNMSITERNKLWRTLEEKYLPHRTYQDSAFLQEGRFWQRQNHIFGMPFYYIDYALAQICALQFWVRDQKDHSEAWQDYLKICKIGGSRSFLDIVKLGGLMNPFEDGCVETVAESAINWLNNIDDSKF